MRFSLRAKRVLVGAAAGALALGLMPVGAATASTGPVCENAPASPFTDKGTTHGANIDCMYFFEVPGDEDEDPFAGERIIAGRTATTFEPFTDMTRGQAATVIVKFGLVATDRGLEDLIDPDEELTNFDDIEGSTHETAIRIAATLDLIQGYGDGNFGPGATLQRAQFAAMLFAAHEAIGVEFEEEYDNPFNDVDRLSVSALADLGIIAGVTATMFDPWAPLQRGQAMSMLALSAEVLFENDLWAPGVIPPQDGEFAPSYTDAPELIAVDVISDDATRTRVDFTFDVEVDPRFLDAQSFYLIAWNGAQIFAEVQDLRRQDQVFDGGATNIIRAAFVKTNGQQNSIRYTNMIEPGFGGAVQFGSVPRALDDIVGAGVAADAVQGVETGLMSLPRSLPIDGAQVAADYAYAPYITGVATDHVNDRVTLEFSRPVAVVDNSITTETAITLYFNDNEGFRYNDGVSLGAVDVGFRVARTRAFAPFRMSVPAPATAPNVVRLDLGTVNAVAGGGLSSGDAGALAKVTLEPGVIRAASTGAFAANPFPQNTLQSIDVATGANGRTPDPDLVGAELDYDNDQVTFIFSEPVTPSVTIDDTVAGVSEDFVSRPDFFQVHYVSSEAQADVNANLWVAFPGSRNDTAFPTGTANAGFYAGGNATAASQYSGVTSGLSVLAARPDLNSVTVQFPTSSITKDITRVSVLSQLVDDNPNPPALGSNWAREDSLARAANGRFNTIGGANVGARPVGVPALGNITPVLGAADPGYGAVYASDGTGAPNVRQSLGIEQTFDVLETIAPDLVSVEWEVVQRDNVDNSPQRYSVSYTFDSAIANFCTAAAIPLLQRDRRSPSTAFIGGNQQFDTDAQGIILQLWEEDGSMVSADCGDFDFTANTGNAAIVGGNTLRVWAGNNPATDLFQLNDAISSVVASIEFGSVKSAQSNVQAGANPVVDIARNGQIVDVNNTKPGLRNYGQTVLIDLPE